MKSFDDWFAEQGQSTEAVQEPYEETSDDSALDALPKASSITEAFQEALRNPETRRRFEETLQQDNALFRKLAEAQQRKRERQLEQEVIQPIYRKKYIGDWKDFDFEQSFLQQEPMPRKTPSKVSELQTYEEIVTPDGRVRVVRIGAVVHVHCSWLSAPCTVDVTDYNHWVKNYPQTYPELSTKDIPE